MALTRHTAATGTKALQLTTRLSNKSWVSYVPRNSIGFTSDFSLQLGDELSDEEDPFAEVSESNIVLRKMLTFSLF